MTTVESAATGTATGHSPAMDAEASRAHPMGSDLNWLLHRVGSGLASALDHVARSHGSSVRGYLLLRAIASCPPTTQLALGEQVGVDKTAVTATLDVLEGQAWIERRPAPNDRRARVTVATRAGREWLERVRPEMEAAEAGLLEDLSPDDVDQLRTLLQRLALGRFASAAPPQGSCV